jgi:hypothetical protein
MVMRYFQSKAGLFTAAVTTDLQVPDLRSVPASRRGELLVRYFVSRWEGPDADDQLIALLRTAVTSEAIAGQVEAILGQRLTERVAALSEEQAAERAALIAAQLLGLALCRYILRFEPLASLPADEVVAAVAPSIDRYLAWRISGSVLPGSDGEWSCWPGREGRSATCGARAGRLCCGRSTSARLAVATS